MDQAELAGLVAGIGLPNTATAEAARARQARLTKPTGALGRLEELSVWVAAAQGACPPRNFERARVVVFAGDHGIARAGVSAYPPEVTGQMVANFLAGGAAVNVLARLAGATVRVVDMAVDADTPEQVRGYKICRSSGRIDQQDALTREQRPCWPGPGSPTRRWTPARTCWYPVTWASATPRPVPCWWPRSPVSNRQG